MGHNSDSLDIAKVSNASGLPASTLRYYEQQGLIQSIGRNGLRRQYDRQILQQLALISLGRNAGFSLQEIKAMLTKDGANIDRSTLLAKAEELEAQIKKLNMMRRGLLHAAKCPAPSHLECPRFQRILGLQQRQRSGKAKI